MISEEKLDLSARFAVATEVARSVGRTALAFRENSGSAGLQIEEKGPQDFVTVADKRAEASIRAAVAAHFPKDGFIGEEGGGELSAQVLWVVDPIDGTTNFIRGYRHWGVSIAVIADNKIQIGVVYDAAVDKVYGAVRGSGAFKDGKRINASPLVDPQKGLAILGHSRRTDFNEYQRLGRELYDLGIDYRRMGAAAIDLVRVADGIADLYYEQHLFGWDMLAGSLIAHEAGAQVLIPALDQALTEGGPVIAVAAGLISRIGFLREAAGRHCEIKPIC